MFRTTEFSEYERDEGELLSWALFIAIWEILGLPYTETDKWSEVQLALGASHKNGDWCFYGGPFLHWVDGESNITVGGVDFTGSFEQDSMFGGFIGVQLDLAHPFGPDGTCVGIEYQQTGRANALVASVLFRF